MLVGLYNIRRNDGLTIDGNYVFKLKSEMVDRKWDE